MNALAEAQAAELPRVERGIAEQQRRRLHNALQDMKGQLRASCLGSAEEDSARAMPCHCKVIIATCDLVTGKPLNITRETAAEEMFVIPFQYFSIMNGYNPTIFQQVPFLH